MHTCESVVRNAIERPGATAVVDGACSFTWSELFERIKALAAGLRSLGCGQSDRVLIVAGNSFRCIEVTYAVQWLGAVIVPLNTRWSADEIGYAAKDSRATVAFVSSDLEQVSKTGFEKFSVLPTLVDIDDREDSGLIPYQDLLKQGGIDSYQCLADNQTASIFYTGGTTGRSKGVMLSHVNHVVHSIALCAKCGFDKNLKYLHAAPMFHIADSLFTHVVSLVGATHIVLGAFDPNRVLEKVKAYNITDTILVPTMIQMLLSNSESRPIFGMLDRLFYGASPMPEAVLEDLQVSFPEIKLFQLYGQTESSPVLTVLDENDHREGGNKLRSAGRPLYGTSVKIIGDDGCDVSNGVVGEIVAHGLQVMNGYWERPKETSSTLQSGWLRTGDAGYIDNEGYVYVTDRIKDMIITGGENVYSVEVEQAIYKFPDVSQCAVIGIPDEKWGEVVAAVVVAKEGCLIDKLKLKNHCASLLADFKCPKEIFIRDEPLPISGAGKILKRELRDSYRKCS